MKNKVIDIIQAVIEHDWAYMLSIFPEGVEHSGVNNTVEDFTEWDIYDDFIRYVSPARTMLIDKCLNHALEWLSNNELDKQHLIKWLHANNHTKFTSLVVQKDNGNLEPLVQIFQNYFKSLSKSANNDEDIQNKVTRPLQLSELSLILERFQIMLETEPGRYTIEEFIRQEDLRRALFV